MGESTISEASEIRVARSSLGSISVWVSGVGYLAPPEVIALAVFLSEGAATA